MSPAERHEFISSSTAAMPPGLRAGLLQSLLDLGEEVPRTRAERVPLRTRLRRRGGERSLCMGSSLNQMSAHRAAGEAFCAGEALFGGVEVCGVIHVCAS